MSGHYYFLHTFFLSKKTSFVSIAVILEYIFLFSLHFIVTFLQNPPKMCDANVHYMYFPEVTFRLVIFFLLGTLVDVVMATDADSGINANVSYRIMKGAYDDFKIDPITGEVFVSRKLNFDVRSSYEIEIVAKDGGRALFPYVTLPYCCVFQFCYIIT